MRYTSSDGTCNISQLIDLRARSLKAYGGCGFVLFGEANGDVELNRYYNKLAYWCRTCYNGKITLMQRTMLALCPWYIQKLDTIPMQAIMIGVTMIITEPESMFRPSFRRFAQIAYALAVRFSPNTQLLRLLVQHTSMPMQCGLCSV